MYKLSDNAEAYFSICSEIGYISSLASLLTFLNCYIRKPVTCAVHQMSKLRAAKCPCCMPKGINAACQNTSMLRIIMCQHCAAKHVNLAHCKWPMLQVPLLYTMLHTMLYTTNGAPGTAGCSQHRVMNKVFAVWLFSCQIHLSYV